MRVKGNRVIAEFFQVSDRTVRNWRAQGAPISRAGEADLGEIQLWQAKRGKGGGGAARQNLLSPQRGKDYEETRLKKAQADKMEMELAARRGELVPVLEVHKWYAAQVAIIKTGLLSFEYSLPPFLEGKPAREISEILHDRVRALLWSFAGKPFKGEVKFHTLPTQEEFVAAVVEFWEMNYAFANEDRREG